MAEFDGASYEERLALLRAREVREAMDEHPDRSRATRYGNELDLFVDWVEARYAAWYGMFHRSQGTVPGKSATFEDCERLLPEIAGMGFDVLYLLPIHPIGRTHRKRPNNTLGAGPDDPGSPYATGSEDGSHRAVHPDLGTLEDFRRFVATCHQRWCSLLSPEPFFMGS